MGFEVSGLRAEVHILAVYDSGLRIRIVVKIRVGHQIQASHSRVRMPQCQQLLVWCFGVSCRVQDLGFRVHANLVDPSLKKLPPCNKFSPHPLRVLYLHSAWRFALVSIVEAEMITTIPASSLQTLGLGFRV